MKNYSPEKLIETAFGDIRKSWPDSLNLKFKETGHIISVGEGIARVSGLPGAKKDELLQFDDGSLGMVYTLEAGELGIILLDDSNNLEAGGEVTRTDRVFSVPVGPGLTGRVVDTLGRPLDGKGVIYRKEMYPAERPAPGIMSRAPVDVPLQTGITCIDAMIPIGRGQRELILGDRQSGKTTIALDTIISQKESSVICIYCAIGKQWAEVSRVVNQLRNQGAMDHTIVVSASCGVPPGLQYMAPYAASSMGEYFMEQGKDVLIVYDDLTWHARAYRELALLLRKPPGREAYPGDIFYIHARLLERSARLRESVGGGSITALPVIETQAEDMSGFIPTNLISITDGQIYLSPALFRKDVLPAIDVGRSVSRVGGTAQLTAYKSVASKLKMTYAQFEELEAFSRFSSRLDEESKNKIRRGRILREVLKQQPFSGVPVAEQIAMLQSVINGYLDSAEPDEVPALLNRIRSDIREQAGKLCDKIEQGGILSVTEMERFTDCMKQSSGFGNRLNGAGDQG